MGDEIYNDNIRHDGVQMSSYQTSAKPQTEIREQGDEEGQLNRGCRRSIMKDGNPSEHCT